MINFYDDVFHLTKRLVQQPSVVGTIDERNMAHLLYDLLSEFPYFQENPTHLQKKRTKRDDRERYNIYALVKGSSETKETVILLGHMDTVDVEDYGKWKRFAFSPDELKEAWLNHSIPAHIKEEIRSDNWLNGRGVLDMKSGVASHIVLLKYFSEHRTELKGNLLLLITCDEENNHAGILTALKDIKRIAKKERLSYIAAITSDYTSPRFSGDQARYIYLGTVGKLLPTFFVVGKETHAGQLFEGFDPNLIVSELTRKLDYNADFCDEMDGEVTFPPVSLKQTDLKKQYDVQTPQTAFAYYNFFVNRRSPKDVLNQLKEVATEAFESAIEIFYQRFQEFSQLNGYSYPPPTIVPRVFTYEEFYNRCVREIGDEFQEGMLRYSINLLHEEQIDIREYSRKMVEELWRWGGDGEPAIILFYSSPYIPRVVLDENDQKARRLIMAVKKAVRAIQPYNEEPIQIRKFYPYLSDMSFVSISDDEKDIKAFEKNMPAWGRKYQYDVESIRMLNVPVINIGPFGKDAHKQWERVELSYSMQMVPNLTHQVIQHLFHS